MRATMTAGRWALGLCAASLALGVSACGSDNDGSTATGAGASSTAATSSAAAPGLEAARKNVEAGIKAPTTIGPQAPVGKAIPSGKFIVHINCGAQACTNTGKGLKSATDALGWKFKEITTAPTPQGIQAAFQEAVRLKPDGVASEGFATSSYRRQLATLAAAKIPVLSDTGTDQPGNGLLLQLQSDVAHKAMALMADKAIVDSNGKGEIGNIILSGYPIVEDYAKQFAAEIAKNCPDCKVKDLTIQPTSIGKDSASLIANFLRANPGIKYIFLGYDDLANGLPTAVANAGVKMPKSYAWAPTQTGMQALKNGERTAAVPQGSNEIGWQFADAFARIFTGGTADEDQKWQDFVLWGKEFNNLPDATDNPPVIADYQAQFKKLWGK
jgi:ABC-type sugar transport system substrate-binding protein